jgi:hypothetical protein
MKRLQNFRKQRAPDVIDKPVKEKAAVS